MKWFIIGLITVIGASAQNNYEARSLNDRGNQLAEEGAYAQSIPLYEESVRIWRLMGPEFEPHAAGTMMNLAVAFCGDGQRKAAAKVFEEALVLHRRSLGIKHLHTLANMNLAASNYLMMGDTERAEALLQEALPVERENYPNDIQLARTQEGISNLFVRRGQGREALAPAEEALRIALKATGEDTVETALAYTSVAEAHRFMGSAARALPLYRKARFIYEKALGAEHPRVATLLSQEGLVLMEDHKLALAEQVMVRSVKILQKSCPECLVELSIAQSNLGLLRLQQRRYRDADVSLTMAVELREKFASKPGPELADALESLAIARQKQRLFADAARLHNRAGAIRGFR